MVTYLGGYRPTLTKDQQSKEECYHQSTIQYDEYENEETGEIGYADFERCRDCNAVLFNGKVIGYSNDI